MDRKPLMKRVTHRNTSIIFVFLFMSVAFLPTSVTSQEIQKVKEFLGKYGWTTDQKLADHQIALPSSFQHKPGDFPIAIYWAYNNELNKAIGLNIKNYLGKSVAATVYSLKEKLPEFLRPYKDAQAVIITSGSKIIGAWIQRGWGGFACSLDRKSFEEVVQRKWGDWLIFSGVVDPSNELDTTLSKKTAEEVITTYYNAINRHDFHLAYATLSRRAAIKHLFANLGRSALFNRSYSEAYEDRLEDIRSAKLLSIKPFRDEANEYEVKVAMKFKETPKPLWGNATYKWFVILTKEIDSLGWRIQEIGTGP